jgi:hypothetical protein
MPIPLFFALGHRRVAANLTVAHAAELLGIAPSYLFAAEEFQKIPDPDTPVKSKFFRGKPMTLAERAAEWLLANPIPSPFRLDPNHVRARILSDWVFYSQYNHYFAGLFKPGDSTVFYWFFDNILTMNQETEEDEGRWEYRRGSLIVAPNDPEVAAAVWWFFMRVWGEVATFRRKTAKDAEFISAPSGIGDVKPNMALGKFWFKSYEVFVPYAPLLFALYTDSITFTYASDSAAWQEWTSAWKKVWAEDRGRVHVRSLVFLTNPPNPPAGFPAPPRPEVVITFHAPYRKLAFHIERTSVGDDVVSKHYFYDGDFYVTVV